MWTKAIILMGNTPLELFISDVMIVDSDYVDIDVKDENKIYRVPKDKVIFIKDKEPDKDIVLKKFAVNIPGVSKLVRRGTEIFLAGRKTIGGVTESTTSYHCVMLHQRDVDPFIHDSCSTNSHKYAVRMGTAEYNYWDKRMKEYFDSATKEGKEIQ